MCYDNFTVAAKNVAVVPLIKLFEMKKKFQMPRRLVGKSDAALFVRSPEGIGFPSIKLDKRGYFYESCLRKVHTDRRYDR